MKRLAVMGTCLALVSCACAPDVHPVFSQLEVDPSALPADGISRAAVTVTLMGTDAKPMAGRFVVLSATGTGNRLVQPSPTGADGVARGFLTSTVAESKTVTATTGGISLERQATVEFNPFTTRLAFGVQPGDLCLGATFADQVTVQVVDPSGKLVVDASPRITVSIGVNPGGATLSGEASADAVDGVAAFPGLRLDRLGTGYTLLAAADGLAGAESSPFEVKAGRATRLVLLRGPAAAVAGVPWAPSFTVRVEDAFGHLVPSPALAIEASLEGGPEEAVLAGPARVNTVGGLATFNGLSIAKAGADYRLLASSQTLAPVASLPFDVRAGAPSATLSTLSASPSSGIFADGNSRSTVTATLRDSFGNLVAGQVVSLSAAGAGASAVQPSAPSGADGVATGAVTSTQTGTKIVSAKAGAVSLAGRASVGFVYAPPEVVALSVAGGGGCVVVSYAVRQAQAQRVDVVVEIDEMGTGAFRRATQAASTTHQGVSGVASVGVPAGQARTFLWNSTRDLPHRSLASARVRVTPWLEGKAGVPMTVANVAVPNGLSFLASTGATLPAGSLVKVAADFDRDGKPDLVIANPGAGEAKVFRGAGDGSFVAGQSVSQASGFSAVIAADFNADGKLDLAASTGTPAGLGIFSGAGDGTFGPAVLVSLPAVAGALVSSDFNADGKLDLATAASALGGTTVLLGNGNGTFGTPVHHASLASGSDSLVAGDFDGDGKTDLAVANRQLGSVSVLLGNGNGTFKPASTFAAGPLPKEVVAGDFNGDGRLDLASLGATGGLSVMLGTGAGAFAAPVSYPAGSAVPGRATLVAADLDGDGRLDLSAGSDTGIFNLMGKGDGSFQPGLLQPSAAGSDVTSAVAADFDLDGRLDLAVGETSTLVMLMNRRPGRCDPGFDAGARTSISYANTVAQSDLDGDGKPDLITGGNGLHVLAGTGSGRFSGAVPYLPGIEVVSIAAGDFDGDGQPDLAAGRSDGHLAVLHGNGDGTLGTPDDYLAAGTKALVATDVNADGVLDLVTAGSVLLGNAGGTFQPALAFAAGPGARGVVVRDFDGDGKVDAATADYHGPSTTILLGNGDGTFRPGSTMPVGIWTYAVTSADLNADGKLDLVTANAKGSVSVLLGNGDGTFRSRTDFAAVGALSVEAREVNGDGRLDLVTAGNMGASVLRGVGDGTFPTRVDFPLGYGAHASTGADFDGDGRWDLAVAFDDWGPHVVIAPGRSDGTFVAPTEIRTLDRPESVALGDFNRDGRPDLAVGSNGYSIALGHGDGTFQAAVASALPGGAYALASADLNGDGKLDLVASQCGKVAVLLGSGDGTFQGAVRYTASACRSVVIHDLNRDGKLDIASANSGSETILLGIGDGTFTPGSGSSGVLAPDSLVAGDFNRDGKPDLATCAGGLLVRLGAGDGTFQTSFTAAIFRGGVAAADFDLDGRLDVANTVYFSGIDVRLGGGDGSLGAATRYAAGDFPEALLAGDFDGDGRPDLLNADVDGFGVELFAGKGDGTFGPRASYFVCGVPAALAAGDLNGDGKLDLAAACNWERGLRILFGR